MNGTLEAASERRALRAALLDHYDREARALPWREDTDPYRILVSEVMLQQTRVETVKGYYGAWLERFPTLDALASADEEEILEAWAGLGYYRRARNLHRAARVVRESHGGSLPDTFDDLIGLPGVGEYTAGAVASIAFDERVPAVDGNVRRVLSRLFDVASPTAGWLRTTAAEMVDRGRPGDWNQALMELGATMCTPRRPRCQECPVARWCAALAAGTVEARPGARASTRPPAGTFVVAVLHARGRVLLEKRPPEGLLAGMWALPEVRVEGGVGSDEATSGGTTDQGQLAADLAARLAEGRGLSPLGEPALLDEVRHRFSHLDARYRPVALEVERLVPAGDGRPPGSGARGPHPPGGRARWVDPARPGLALPVAQSKILDAWRLRRTPAEVA